MKRKCVFFRVDSGNVLGFGHLNRCLILADEFKMENFEVHFICQNLEGNLIKNIRKCGFKIHQIRNSNDTITNDFQKTKQILEKFQDRISCLVIDNYRWNKKYEGKLRSMIKCIFIIDDLANRKHDCDILLDQNLYTNFEKRYEKLVSKKCMLLLGPKYILLRKEFFSCKKRKKIEKLKKIFISFGGQDCSNQSIKVLNGIHRSKLEFGEINVVVGKSNKFFKQLRKISKQIKNVKIFSDINNISCLMEMSDLGVGAGGSMMWERAYLGIPGLVSIIAKNQELTARSMEKIHCVKNLGLAKNVSSEDYKKFFLKIKVSDLDKMSQKNMRIIDGDGKYRIIEKVVGLIKEQENREKSEFH